MRSVLVISDRDNVATALEALDTGRTLELRHLTLTVREPIQRGHKIALTRIAAGESVIKYGSTIGKATVDIEAGSHVHTHNVSSTRGRGDLAPQRP
jgi:SAF domain-containing protein